MITPTTGIVTIESDLQQADNTTGIVTATGNVRIVYPDQRVVATARQAQYYSKEGRVVLSGDVDVIQADGHAIKAERVVYDVNRERISAEPPLGARSLAVTAWLTPPPPRNRCPHSSSRWQQAMSLNLHNIVLAVNGRVLVNHVSLELSPGEVVGLLGPNGAGKTTTFGLVTGLIRADAGEILMDGLDIRDLPMPQRARLGIGYLPQEPSVFRQLTVRDNLCLALQESATPKAIRRDRLEALISDFHLKAFQDRKGFQLSGGERRRCEVARALAVGESGPRYLLLDEPFAGVDPIAVADLQQLIDQLRNRGMGLLITDHNVRETLAITDRAYILSDGSILASGTSDQVGSDPWCGATTWARISGYEFVTTLQPAHH